MVAGARREHARRGLNGPLVQRLAALLIAAFVGIAQGDDLAPLEKQKIDYLIATIEALDNAKFVRNGTAYDAKAAADHLRLKLKKTGSPVKTAEDFIRYCASVPQHPARRTRFDSPMDVSYRQRITCSRDFPSLQIARAPVCIRTGFSMPSVTRRS